MMPLSETADLPTPAQMAALQRAWGAARQARRMIDASRALITGNIAFVFCLLGLSLTLMHSGWAGESASFFLCGLVTGYLIGSIFLFRWLNRRNKNNPVPVITCQEEACQLATPNPSITSYFPLLAAGIVVAVAALGWMVAFRFMSTGSILAVLFLTPLAGISFFVGRFVLYQFWEDLLFAGCITLAFLPFYLLFLARVDLPWLSLVALPIVILGVRSLHTRWKTWIHSIPGDSSPEDSLSRQP